MKTEPTPEQLAAYVDHNARAQACLEEVADVLRKHGFSLSHQDQHGAFELEPYDAGFESWLLSAHVALSEDLAGVHDSLYREVMREAPPKMGGQGGSRRRTSQDRSAMDNTSRRPPMTRYGAGPHARKTHQGILRCVT